MAWTTSTLSYDLSRPSSPSEKRRIEVPGIVLTEAPSTRARSPPPKQIVLLNPATLTPSRPSPFSALFGQTGRTLVLVMLLALAMWHLYSTTQLNSVMHVHVPVAAMEW